MKPEEWDAEMAAFVPRDNVVVSIEIVHPIDFVMGRGDQTLAYAVDSWFTGRLQAKDSPLCMTCDHEWSVSNPADSPAAFVIIINEDGKAIVCGLCRACDDHKEREARYMAVVKQAFGEVSYCAPGTGRSQ